jgi:hypothetical protein
VIAFAAGLCDELAETSPKRAATLRSHARWYRKTLSEGRGGVAGE